MGVGLRLCFFSYYYSLLSVFGPILGVNWHLWWACMFPLRKPLLFPVGGSWGWKSCPFSPYCWCLWASAFSFNRECRDWECQGTFIFHLPTLPMFFMSFLAPWRAGSDIVGVWIGRESIFGYSVHILIMVFAVIWPPANCAICVTVIWTGDHVILLSSICISIYSTVQKFSVWKITSRTSSLCWR